MATSSIDSVPAMLPSGEAVAAFTSPVIGFLAMAAANLRAEATPAFDKTLLVLGSWMPGYHGIGPYSGKETVMLLAWLGSWALLHFTLRGRELVVKHWLTGALVGVAVAAALFWPPFFEYFLKE